MWDESLWRGWRKQTRRRALVAAMAMQGLAFRYGPDTHVAGEAVDLADALIAALNKESK